MRVLFLALLPTIALASSFGKAATQTPEPHRESTEPAANADQSWLFDYDDNGRLASLRSPGGPSAKFSRQTAPDQGEILRVSFSDGSNVEHHFNRFGRRIARKDWLGKIEYRYDSFGRLDKVVGGGKTLLEYRYDAQDRLVSVVVAEKFKTRRSYDFLGRISQRGTPLGAIVYQYFPAQGIRTRTLPNGVQTTWEFDADGRLMELNHADAKRSVIVRFQYRYRPDGRLAEVQEWNRNSGALTTVYQYDALGRLIGAAESDQAARSYAYDQLGSRTRRREGEGSVESVSDWSGRLVEIDGMPAHYDAAGNLVADGRGRRFEYTGQSRIALLSREGRTARFAYDGDGRLVSRTVDDGPTTHYLTAPESLIWKPLMKREDGGEPVFYIWEEDLPLAEVSGGTPLYYLHDHLGSVRYAVSAKGTVVEERDCTPFGAPALESIDQTQLRAGFAGMFYDPVGQVYLTRGRAYDPSLGRFLQIDPAHRVPMGSQHDLSPYAYCGGDPVNFQDRSGLYPVPVVDFGYQWSEAVRLQELRRQLEMQKYLTQRLADRTSLERSLRNTAASTAQNILLQYQGQLFSDYAATMESLANLYRSALGLGPYSGNLPSLANRTFQAATTIFGSLLSAVQLTADTLKYIGTSAMIINPPPYPMRQTPTGWRGVGEIQLAEGLLRFDENWNTAAPKWWQAGTIDHQRRLRLDSPYGSYEETLSSSTPATSPVERFMMHHFPLGSYFDPMTTRETRTRTTRESYRVVTSNGLTRVEPLGAEERLKPSPVGGVYLQGAGNLLEDLGEISGVALDEETGSFTLVGGDGRQWALPPLTLDDLAAVFRSVYLTPKGPFVSIDPVPSEPRGPWMKVRLHPELENSYVGWVLFQADRVMKTYSLGFDNVTRQPVRSKVEGYKNLLELGGPLDSEIWERFWIVPAAVHRRESSSGRLALLDVPLRVQTQRMVMNGGTLSPAKDDRPSDQASYFSKWFSDRYPSIEKEVFLQPPPGSGRLEPIPVFSELRRIATLTAAAELLKSRGMPLPHWIREHQVARVEIDPKTPALVVSETEGRIVAREGQLYQVRRQIYGGVNLSPEPDSVTTARSDDLADGWTERLDMSPGAPAAYGTVPLPTADGERPAAATLPGYGSMVPLPLRRSETDFSIDLTGGDQFELRRHLNSLFRPSDIFGTSPWTLDLPRLSQRPLKLAGEEGTVQLAYHLESPLGTFDAPFQAIAPVPETGGKLIVPAQPDSDFLGLAAGRHPSTGEMTQLLLLRNGGQWHFNMDGLLVAAVSPEAAVVFHRLPAGRISIIEIRDRNRSITRLHFEYDSRGWLREVRNKDQTTRYSYDAAGLLTRVVRAGESTEYEYEDHLLKQVSQSGSVLQRFHYNRSGQLLREEFSDGSARTYEQRREEDGFALKMRSQSDGSVAAEAHFDRSFRPVDYRLADGARFQWLRNEDGVRLVRTSPAGLRQEFSCSGAEGCAWIGPRGEQVRAVRDKGEWSSSFLKGNQEWISFRYLPDGRPLSVRTADSEIRFQFGQDGGLHQIVLVDPAEKGPRVARWLQLTYDSQGRPARVKDYSGSDVAFSHDQQGRLSMVRSRQGSWVLKRDARGRVASLTTGAGRRQQNLYDAEGELSRVRITHGSSDAEWGFQKGRLHRIREFAGWEGQIDYQDRPGLGHVLSSIQGPGVKLRYEVDQQGRITGVDSNDAMRLRYEYDELGRLVRFTRSPIDR